MTSGELNPFDRKLKNNESRIPSDIHGALIYVHDTLEFCISSAETHFGKEVSPEISLEIYDRVIQRINNYREDERRIDEKLDELTEQRETIEKLIERNEELISKITSED